MCSIAGLIALESNRRILDNMLATMRLRGPDENGEYISPLCALLHCRLAIIDPESGKQPMTLSWHGEDYCLVYNGELYNTAEVRRELVDLGHHFTGHSDTEVILHAYARWGSRCVDKFNGIFAFAVWEQRRKRLFLARDRIGVKPLFYKLHQGGLIFASEVKTILAYPTVKAQLDEVGAAQILMLGPGRLPGSGVLRDIREIEPGCCGYYEEGKLQLRRYWKLHDRIHTDTLEQTLERIRYLVTDSIQRQMVSDVPVGAFLSGGLDSSLICSVCGKAADEGLWRLPTFSVDYLNNDQYFRANKFQPNSDSHYIRLMEEYLNTDHHWTVLDSEQLISELENATIARDLPGMADVDFSLLAFCREIRKHVKVALSGECADEIFGGYPWYRDPEILASEGFPWAQNTRQRSALMSHELARRIDGESLVFDAYSQTCAQSDILPENSPQERRMKEMVNLNFTWFMQTLLDRKDRMSMYNSLEVRVPFCDYRIAEYMYAVPWEMKDYQGKEKGLLRKAMEGLLPEEVMYRKKSPYPKTFDPTYTHAVRNRFDALLQDRNSPVFALADRHNLSQLPDSESPWPWYGQLMRLPQTMAYFLQLDFWLRHYSVELLF